MERRLYRNKENKIIGGVCAGLAEYFDIDPVLVRLLFVLLVFQGGLGVLAYIILWIVVPARKADLAVSAAGEASKSTPYTPPARPETPPEVKTKRATVAGGILIVIGVLFLVDNLIPGFCFSDLWPLIFIALGGGLLWNSLSEKHTQETLS